MTQFQVADDEQILERLMLREAAHTLKADAGLITAGGADRDHRPRRGEQVVNADLRRKRGLGVAAGQNRRDLPRRSEVGAGDPLLVRQQWLVDQLAELDEAGQTGTNHRVKANCHVDS